jgi:hypothetical protein
MRAPKFACWVSTILTLMVPDFANASDNVQKLLQECNADISSPDFFHCAGYVGGVADMMFYNGLLITKYNANLNTLSHVAACPGNPYPTYGADIQAFRNWAQKHPEKWAEQTSVGVISALREAWPCP